MFGDTADRLPEALRTHPRLSLVRASVLDLDDAAMADQVRGCGAVASCLGHNISLKGVFGPPHRLVTDATRRLCEAIRANKATEVNKANAPNNADEPGKAGTPIRFVLMNTAGNANRDLREPASFAERCLLAVLRRLLPPQADNEDAADYLRVEIGQDDETIEWAVVRPDTLIREDAVTDYAARPSPTRSALFHPGKTSRINVAHFMAVLITDDAAWSRWKGQMPVLYNEGER